MSWPEHLLPDTTTWRPERIPGDDESLRRLATSGRVTAVHDTFAEQVRELACTPDDPDGTWLLYPWSGRLVHVLSRDDFRRVRADRNRDKITREEQDRLRRATIGIVGLSVGHAAALTLATEGVGGRLRLADFDALSLSNLNRLRAGVHDLGLPKAILAARAIAELDPYVDVEILPQGIDESNLEGFLEGLDLLVEECDDLAMKLRLRERARARGVPVLMDTSDRGLLDVERFDREPERPLLHGLIGELRAADLVGLSRTEKIPYILQILGETTLSDRLAASLPEVDASLRTWPQLASAVALGGALVTDTARRILLDQFTASGRWHVDFEALVAPGEGPPSPRAWSVASQGEAPSRPTSAPTWLADLSSRRREGGPPLSPDIATITALVSAAIQAPTGHNAQPWRFLWRDGALACTLDRARCLPALDFDDVGAWAGLGAAALNLELAASVAGLHATFEETEGWTARFTPGSLEPDPLAGWIDVRATQRAFGTPTPLGADADALLAAAEAERCRLRLVLPGSGLDAVAEAIGEADRIAWLLEPLHRMITEGLRWSPAEVAAHRDGLDVEGLDLPPAARAGLRLVSRWPRARLLAERGLGRALVKDSVALARASSAIGLLVAPIGSGRIAGGRAMQRVWLEAARRGVGLHPVATLPSLLARRAAGRMDALGTFPGLDADLERAGLLLRGVFPKEEGVEVLLFRLLHAPIAPARSVRRPVEAVLSVR
jgi:hypothetical protein